MKRREFGKSLAAGGVGVVIGAGVAGSVAPLSATASPVPRKYPYMILPDHNPSHPDDPGKLQAYAFAYGYIKALIQAVNSEVQA